MSTQALFKTETQSEIAFPRSLAEKYQARRIGQLVGVEEVKRVYQGLIRRPRPCSLLNIGEPGSGKTVSGMALAEQLPGSLIHIQAQKCDVDRLDELNYQVWHYPSRGKWWVVLIDEADGMTEKAQLQLLSKMDGTAALRPVFGGGFERGEQPPVIYVFTANSRSVNGEMKPPAELLPRFVSRCHVLKFEKVEQRKLAKYLAAIWELEKGTKGLPMEYFEYVADGLGVRDALVHLDSELIAPRSKQEIIKMLDQGIANPDSAVIDEDEERWDGFLVEDGQPKLEAIFSAKVTRFEVLSQIAQEANDKCRTIVTGDGGQYLQALRQAQKLENRTRCGGCGWGLLVVPKKEKVLRKADIIRGVRIADKTVPWKAVGLANLCVTVEASGRVRVAKLPRCAYCVDRYQLPKAWRLEDQTAGEWSVAA